MQLSSAEPMDERTEKENGPSKATEEGQESTDDVATGKPPYFFYPFFLSLF